MALAWSPIGGIFKMNEDSKLNKHLDLLADKYSCSKSQIALSWLMGHPAKIYPVLGTSKPERIKESIDSIEISLELQD
jgi:predicted oxidoreductase